MLQADFRVNLNDTIGDCKYFKWKEALYLHSISAYAVPTLEQIRMIKATAKMLDKIRDHFKKPIIIHSWLRPDKYNQLIGGVSRSMHISGGAVDFHVQGIDCEDVKKEIIRAGIWAGRGEYDSDGWIHLDIRRGQWFYARSK